MQYELGVDLGGTKTEIIALDESGLEVFRKRVSTVKGSYADTIKTISSLVFEAQDVLGQTCPLGIAIPGSVCHRTQTIKNANSYWLNGHDLKQDLAVVLKHENIFLENDANCFALSEATDGAGANDSLVWGIILGTGSGSGLVHNKVLLRGKSLLTGEWGHNPLPWLSANELERWADVECFCQRKYCIETFVSGTGLEREYAKATNNFNAQSKVYDVSAKQVIELMHQNQDIAKASFDIYCDRLARALACYINFIDPDVIVLGGGMSQVKELYEVLPQLIGKYIFGGDFATKIVPAKFSDSSGVRGAAWLPKMFNTFK